MTHEEWIEVSALDTFEAEAEALREPRVIRVLESQYEEPDAVVSRLF